MNRCCNFEYYEFKDKTNVVFKNHCKTCKSASELTYNGKGIKGTYAEIKLAELKEKKLITKINDFTGSQHISKTNLNFKYFDKTNISKDNQKIKTQKEYYMNGSPTGFVIYNGERVHISELKVS